MWLCLNERSEEDNSGMNTLMLKATPATKKVQEISELILPLMMQASENV